MTYVLILITRFLQNISEWTHRIWNFYQLKKTMIHSIVPKVFENDARKNGVGEKKKNDMIERTQNIPFYD